MNLKRITSETGVQFSPKSEGVWQVFAPNQEAYAEADDIIQKLLDEERVPEFDMGRIYQVKVVEVKEKGISVELHPGLENVFIHNSQLSARKVRL